MMNIEFFMLLRLSPIVSFRCHLLCYDKPDFRLGLSIRRMTLDKK
jgi:hypothetical protein